MKLFHHDDTVVHKYVCTQSSKLYRMWYVTFRELNRAVLRVKIPLDAVFKALFTLFADLKRYDISAGLRAIIYLEKKVTP